MTTTSRNRSATPQRRLPGERGNILIYVLMTMVIFAVIGVTMVSLFSTSISSSATANETRRAFYLSESGIRYAVSELRQNGFSATNINRTSTPTTLQDAAGWRLRRPRFRRLVPIPVQPERRRRDAYGRARKGQDPDRVSPPG